MSNDPARRFHEHWLGLVQPIDGLVVTVPVLVDAQCMERLDASAQRKLSGLCDTWSQERIATFHAQCRLQHQHGPGSGAGAGFGAGAGDGSGSGAGAGFGAGAGDGSGSGSDANHVAIADVFDMLTALLDLRIDDLDLNLEDRAGLSTSITQAHSRPTNLVPAALALYVPEGRQELRPTAALRRREPLHSAAATGIDDLPDDTPSSRAGQAYEALIWQLPPALPLDTPETVTGPWEYAPSAKFDRLLRATRVPIGLLCNGRELRLCYAPHGESSGAITFRLDDMLQVGGRPILDAFVMLLSEFRWFGAPQESRLSALLAASRTRQADVTNELAEQLMEALSLLLAGFEAAAERDGDQALLAAQRQPGDHLYSGLLTVLLRMVFVLYAEDRGLLPLDSPMYGSHLSLLSLHAELTSDAATHPDEMALRFGAYARFLSLSRALYFGVEHGESNRSGTDTSGEGGGL